jgi:hypothetical protein
MATDIETTKQDILEALAHPEASDGLYFRNFAILHEEDERPAVRGSQIEILEALKLLLTEGQIQINDEEVETIFFLSQRL